MKCADMITHALFHVHEWVLATELLAMVFSSVVLAQ